MKHLFHKPSNYCPVICGNCIFGISQVIWDGSRVLEFQVLGNAIPAILRQSQRVLICHFLR